MDKSFLTVKELSLKLGVSEKTVYRMVTAGSIPFAIKIGGQWRFNSEKIEKWIAESDNSVSRHTNLEIQLTDALAQGAIIYRAHGENRDEVLDEIFATLSSFSPDEVTGIKKQIFYRESIISSSLNGIAVMMPDSVDGDAGNVSRLVVAFLEKAMDFKAVDGQQTEVVFLLLPVNRSEGLVLKTKLARLLMEPAFVKLLKSQLRRKQLAEGIAAAEKAMLPRRTESNDEEYPED